MDEQERHKRRMMLMQMMGETNRMEQRSHILMAIAGLLAMISAMIAIVF